MKEIPYFQSFSIKDVIAWVFHYFGISYFFFWLNRDRKRIITYHNVIPDDQFQNKLHEGVSHSSSVFRKQIKYLQKKFPCDTDIADPRSLTITFDDGYLNQYQVAHLMLTEYRIRAYFFITLGLYKSKDPLIIDKLLCWLSYVASGTYCLQLQVSKQEVIVIINEVIDRRLAWDYLSELLSTHEIDEEELLVSFEAHVPFAEIFSNIPDDTYLLRFTPILKEQLEEMKAYGHQIGAHGVSHRIMAFMTEKQLKDEVSLCQSEVGKLYNTTVFSYPFGGFSEVTSDVINCVHKHGFTTGLSNTNIPTTSDINYSNLFLPRLSLPNTSSVHQLSFVLSGAKYFLQHFRLLPNI